MIADVDAFLAAAGYHCLSCALATDGLYSAKDSEWNYSDVPHLNYVHARVEGCPLLTTNTHASSLFLQRIGPFAVPASLHVSHVASDVHDYLLIVLNIIVRVTTHHQPSGAGCLTTTRYNFYFRGILGRLVALMARYATRRNYRVLMSEDLPMREQRHRLRQLGVVFAYDRKPLIGFVDTLNVHENHVDATALSHAERTTQIDLSSDDGDLKVDQLLLRLTWDYQSVKIWPLICPHEGAPLSACAAQSSRSLMCPWHGRRLSPLAVVPRSVLDQELGFGFCRLEYLIRCTSIGSNQLRLQLVARPKHPES
jgi:hypothetical protein